MLKTLEISQYSLSLQGAIPLKKQLINKYKPSVWQILPMERRGSAPALKAKAIAKLHFDITSLFHQKSNHEVTHLYHTVTFFAKIKKKYLNSKIMRYLSNL
jgi:hypothetical protein